jgi:hypothetical protein
MWQTKVGWSTLKQAYPLWSDNNGICWLPILIVFNCAMKRTGQFGNGRKGVYEHLTKDEVGPAYKAIWRAKIPEKVRIFMWLIAQKAVLTKDNMIRKNWQGDPNCYFCGSIEIVEHLLFNCPIAMVVWGVVALSIHQKYMPTSYEQSDPWIKKALPGGEVVHMFGLAAICWSIWKARNMACFEKKLIKNPNEVIFSARLFMQFWAGPFKGDM